MIFLVLEEEQVGEDVGLGPFDTGLEVREVGHVDVLGPPLQGEAFIVVEVFRRLQKKSLPTSD